MWYFYSFKLQLCAKFNYKGQMCHFQKFVETFGKNINLPCWLEARNSSLKQN